ncbi:MAG: hypothetical protein M1829_000194 [Trizodia sp. TS-e1964]|nr:MAG: hypothetical protein M1829_000194 [Trizodia sp. TS-e1964]
MPKNESHWYLSQSIDEYGPQARIGFDELENSLLLRSDVHTLFDARRFVILPKFGKWIIHVRQPGRSIQFTKLYHNVELQPLQDVGHEQLFARFAWAILSEFSAQDCAQLAKIGKTLSANPRKRKASESAIAEDELNGSVIEWEEENRGHKRRRIRDWLLSPKTSQLEVMT